MDPAVKHLLRLFANAPKQQGCEGRIHPWDLHFDDSGLMPECSGRHQSRSIHL